MNKYEYRGFDKLDEDSSVKLALPLCDILRSFLGERDFSYISAAFYPIEMVELILHYLKYEKSIDSSDFAAKYLTEDSLCPIDSLLAQWDTEKFNQMIAELSLLAK